MADVFTSAGKAFVTDLVSKNSTAPTNYYIHWGTDGTTANKSNTALGTASAEARVTAVISNPSADISQFVATLTSGSTQTIQEAGLFDASTAGTMVIRGDHAGVAVDNGDKITYTITLEMT
jgi:hypothetical protein